MKLLYTKINSMSISYLALNSETVFQKFISGKIINSVVDPNKKHELLEWKRKIAKNVFEYTNGSSPDIQYAISLSMTFSPALHGNRKLDVENYVKPIIDGIAAGMFCPKDQDPLLIDRFCYDDSNFNKLFIEKLDDCKSENDGLVITIVKL